MLLRSGSQGMDVLAVAQRLIAEAGSLHGLLRWSVEDFTAMRGIGKVKALQLITVMEIARRVLNQSMGTDVAFDTAEKVYEYMLPQCAGLDVEKFWVLCLNRKNRLLRCVEVTSGTASSSLAHPREVFREAVRLSATAIIAAHNHPSGDPSPSQSDIRVTKQMREAGKLIDIPVLDHVIIGQRSCDAHGQGYYSFQAGGML